MRLRPFPPVSYCLPSLSWRRGIRVDGWWLGKLLTWKFVYRGDRKWSEWRHTKASFSHHHRNSLNGGGKRELCRYYGSGFIEFSLSAFFTSCWISRHTKERSRRNDELALCKVKSRDDLWRCARAMGKCNQRNRERAQLNWTQTQRVVLAGEIYGNFEWLSGRLCSSPSSLQLSSNVESCFSFFNLLERRPREWSVCSGAVKGRRINWRVGNTDSLGVLRFFL